MSDSQELQYKKEAFIRTNVKGYWKGDGDVPIPEPVNPSISTNISFVIAGEEFEELSQTHYLEKNEELSLPLDFFAIDSYLINIQINETIKQVRFSRNATGLEKYGTTMYEYDNVIYEYLIYIINEGPIVKISSTTLGIREEEDL